VDNNFTWERDGPDYSGSVAKREGIADGIESIPALGGVADGDAEKERSVVSSKLKKDPTPVPTFPPTPLPTEAFALDKSRTVWVWQGERRDHALKFMYKMLQQSIIEGVQGLGVRAVFMYTNYVVPPEAKPGDLGVWVGSCIFQHPLMLALKQKGIRTVLYQTEYMNYRSWHDTHGKANQASMCDKLPDWNKRYFDEIWDYGWGNIGEIKKCSATLPDVRYVPAGYLQNWPRHPDFTSANPNFKLIFFGSLAFDRAKCWEKVLEHPLAKANIANIYNIWDDRAFQGFVNDPAAQGVFLNFHKFCTYPRPPGNATRSLEPRMSQLMSTKVFIISERSHWKDEALYEGIVDFVEMHDVGKAFEKLYNLSVPERQALLDKRFELYKKRFNPSEILRRAKVHLLFQKKPVVLID